MKCPSDSSAEVSEALAAIFVFSAALDKRCDVTCCITALKNTDASLDICGASAAADLCMESRSRCSTTFVG